MAYGDEMGGIGCTYKSACGRCSSCEIYIKGFCQGEIDYWDWRDCPQRNPYSKDPRIVNIIKKVKEWRKRK